MKPRAIWRAASRSFFDHAPLLAAGLLILCLGGSAIAGQVRYDGLYHRALEDFASALFLKPTGTNSEDLIYRLAPLLMNQVGKERERAAGFGRLTLSNSTVAVNGTRPTVYFDTGTVVLRGKVHPQFSYLWFYPDRKTVRAQGVRLTLDSQGAPVLWESFEDSSGLKVVFAAHSLEDASVRAYGGALPGRHFSLEPASKATRKLVVARVIEDGPVPMGPVVYLDAAKRDIVTVLCRCMPPQVNQLAGEGSYELAPFSEARSLLQVATPSTRRSRALAGSFDPPGSSRPALEALRLPAEW